MPQRRRGRPSHPDILTPAEWSVLNLVRHGVSTSGIARLRGTSADAVKAHTESIRAKLGLADRTAVRHWRGAHAGSALAQSPSLPTAEDIPVTDTLLRLGPIGQVSRHVSDVSSAVDWYGRVLGLPHLYTFGTIAFFDCGGVRLFLSQPEPGSGALPGSESILYFRVADIAAAHDELTSRGVVFVGAPHMIHRHADGTEEWMAFFRDPDGGVLGLMAQMRGPTAG